MCLGTFQPFQNQKPPIAGKRAKNGLDVIVKEVIC